MRRAEPSYGRGPNARFYDQMVAHETNRAKWYPAPGYYLACVRNADQVTSGGGLIQMEWCSRPLDRVGWAAEKIRAIHARINAKGGRRYSRYNDPHTIGLATCFVRDAFRLRDGTIRFYGFESRACRERLSHLVPERDNNEC
jgi:hypothetical protein